MKIGIYGGSYNPVHKGHTELAKALREQGLVDEVWLMVSPLNPLKQEDRAEYASYDDRVKMVQIATEGMKGVKVSDFERDLPLPSYTITTMEALEKAFPEHQFVLVVGADNWQRFDRWYKAEEIRRRYPILVYKRPGYEVSNKETVDTPLYDVSSTQIRQAIREGADTSHWLDSRVANYIKENGLYKA